MKRQRREERESSRVTAKEGGSPQKPPTLKKKKGEEGKKAGDTCIAEDLKNLYQKRWEKLWLKYREENMSS